MALLVAIVLLPLSCWGIIATFRRLRRTRAGRAWWAAFAVLAATGLVAGSWLCFVGYQASPRHRFFGFPIPVALYHLENGQWVDYVLPEADMCVGMVADVAALTAAALLPLLIVSIVVGRRRRKREERAARGRRCAEP